MGFELIVTILIAIIPPVLAYIQSKKDKIIFAIYDSVNLFNSLNSDFKDISISYKNKSVERNLFLLKGYIFYVGQKDIKESKNKVSIQGSDDSRILDFSISDKPDGMVVEHEIDSNKAYLFFDLIKSNEYIYTNVIRS